MMRRVARDRAEPELLAQWHTAGALYPRYRPRG